jgi:hypothetical protein
MSDELVSNGARDGRGPALFEVVVMQLGRDPPAHRDPIERH